MDANRGSVSWISGYVRGDSHMLSFGPHLTSHFGANHFYEKFPDEPQLVGLANHSASTLSC